MTDKYQNILDGIESPASSVVEITPSDTVDLDQPIRGIAFGNVGAIKVLMLDGATVTIRSGVLAAGMIHPLRIRRVFATGTTATNIIGVF